MPRVTKQRTRKPEVGFWGDVPGTPGHLRLLLEEGMSFGPEIALDTETSGLYMDDGARVSTVSLAWLDVDREWGSFTPEGEQRSRFPGLTWGVEQIAPDGYEAAIVSVAWPFDQGTEGKPEDDGQGKLWPDADNLDYDQWLWLLKFLEVACSQHGARLVMHNGPFDLEKMRVGCRRWPGVGTDLEQWLHWDTQNVNDLLWPLEKTSLKPTCARIFGKEWADEGAKVRAYLKKHKLPTGRWDLIPWDIVGKYADTDARITLMLKLRQEWELRAGAGSWLLDAHATADRRLAVSKLLGRMTARGLPYPAARSRRAAEQATERARELAQKLPFEPNEARAFFFKEDYVSKKGYPGLGLIPYATTEGGAPSLTAEVLSWMVKDNVDYAAAYAEYTKVTNAVSMWYAGYADKVGPDGRLRTYFRQNGTRSSRFSVERVNLQAIPQDYRLSGFSTLEGIPTPRELIGWEVAHNYPGWTLWELDLAQAELRVAALLARCGSMLKMIADGTDLHGYTTKQLFGIDESDSRWAEYRQVGKRANFTLCFGAGVHTFAEMVARETGIQLEGTAEIVRGWNALYPEFRRAIDKHRVRVENRVRRYGHGWVTWANGERRWFQPYEDPHKAFNQRVQGNIAQFGIDWMLASEQILTGAALGVPPFTGAGLLLTIHDSQVLLLPDDDGEHLADRCAKEGGRLWSKWFSGVPGEIDAKRWGEK